MWENILELGSPQVTVWCLHVACWIPKAKITQSEYVILFSFPRQQWLHECTSVLCFIYIACLVCCFQCTGLQNNGEKKKLQNCWIEALPWMRHLPMLEKNMLSYSHTVIQLCHLGTKSHEVLHSVWNFGHSFKMKKAASGRWRQ